MAYVRFRKRGIRKNGSGGKQILLIFAMLLFLISVIIGEKNRSQSLSVEETDYTGKVGLEWVTSLIPIAGFLEEPSVEHSFKDVFFSLFFCSSPLYEYASDSMESEENQALSYSYEMVVLKEGSDEEYEQMLMTELEEENREEQEATTEGNASVMDNELLVEQVVSENIEATEEYLFVPPQNKSLSYNRVDLMDFDFLIENFYVVDAGTTITEERLPGEELLSLDMTIEDTEGPQILIYHTHSQEGYIDSIPGDSETSIVGVGELLATILREDYGYEVLHHTGEYDVEQRDYAYSNAEPEITRILQENPSIQVVIDLHRDEVSADRKLVTEINGQPTAQFMLFNGLSYVNDLGSIDYLYNPNLTANLAFSLQMQVAANEYYPGLTRKIYLKGYRYNMHLMDKYLLIELGAQTNTVEEARNACYPIAYLLNMVLRGQNPH